MKMWLWFRGIIKDIAREAAHEVLVESLRAEILSDPYRPTSMSCVGTPEGSGIVQTSEPVRSSIGTMITREQIHSIVEIGAPAVIREIYELTTRQIQLETTRQTAIDNKASSLLATVGISISVALATLSATIKPLRDASFNAGVFIVVIGLSVLFSLACALIACVYAYRSIRITDEFMTIDENAVFNKEAIAVAARQSSDDVQAMAYRQFLVPQLGEIMQNDYAINERKATLVRKGQMWYITMIVSLLVIGMLLMTEKLAG